MCNGTACIIEFDDGWVLYKEYEKLVIDDVKEIDYKLPDPGKFSSIWMNDAATILLFVLSSEFPVHEYFFVNTTYTTWTTKEVYLLDDFQINFG